MSRITSATRGAWTLLSSGLRRQLSFLIAHRAIITEFRDISYRYYNLTGDPIPEHIHVREVFAIGHTRTAKELLAVSQIPPSRVVRGLGLLTENVAADAIPPPCKATLQSLLCRLLRRMLTPWHVPMPELRYDSWFRTKVLPIAADEDGHPWQPANSMFVCKASLALVRVEQLPFCC